jgi:hypothetical protein
MDESEWLADNRAYCYKDEPPFPNGTIVHFAVIGGYAWLHNLYGPARIWSDDRIDKLEWWLYGDRICCSSQEEFEQLMKLKAFW